jgi:TRAP-type C4-dicarboxylate transport system permease small subunit
LNAFRDVMRVLVRFADQTAASLLVAICALNLAAVFMRYVMLDAISWSEEAIRYMAVWMTFLGVASASWLDEHMDMNLFDAVGGETVQRLHRAFLHLLAIVFGVIVLWQGSVYVSLNGMQTAPTTGLAIRWIYGAIPVGGLLLVLVSAVKLLDCFVPPPEDAEGRPLL